jgi:predicted dehydrogenase
VTVSIAVVGAGVMGANHARVLRDVPGARLSAVIDLDAPRARALAIEHGCFWGTALDEIPADTDAAIIATPTTTHLTAAVAALSRGLHVLVEKPFASTVEEARKILDEARRNDRILAVGHIERFNPACLDLPRFVSTPTFIQTRRLSPFNERIEEGVVRDMMIHDVDVVLWLARSAPVRINADIAYDRSRTEDLAVATLVFESGLVAQMTATRIGQDKVRRIAVVQRDSVIDVDLLRQDITIRRQSSTEFTNDGGRRFKEASVVEIPYLDHRGEPLLLELTDFVDSIARQREPLVNGSAGLASLEICQQILDAARQRVGQAVHAAASTNRLPTYSGAVDIGAYG